MLNIFCFTKLLQMKNFTTLLIAAAILFPGVASAKDLRVPKMVGKSIVPSTRQATPERKFKAATPQKADAVGQYGDIIYEAPEGKVEQLTRSGVCLFPYYYQVYEGSYENVIGEIVIADNDEVYLKNPISTLVFNSYIKGHKEDNKIIFDFPQAIGADEYAGGAYEYLVTLVKYYTYEDEYGEDWSCVPCNTDEARELGFEDVVNQIIIDINEDGSYTYATDMETMVMPGVMYSDDLSWAQYAEINAVWKEMTMTPNPGFSGETQEVAVKYESAGHFAQIAIDGEDVYVKGLFMESPDSWIQGKCDGDKISFASGQYLGPNFEYNYYTFFVAGELATADDDVYGPYKYADEIVFNYDEASLTLTSPEESAVVYSVMQKDINELETLAAPVITKQSPDISQVPATPFGFSYDQQFDRFGYNALTFNLPMTNAEGDILNTANLYYGIYLNGDLYEFSTDDYGRLEENMELIPYSFADNYDFEASGISRTVYFYVDGVDEYGVQIFNMVDGEVIAQSEMGIYNVGGTGIQMVGDSSNKVTSNEFFNMNGQRISNPSEGIFIKKVKYSDGTVKSFKVVKK